MKPRTDSTLIQCLLEVMRRPMAAPRPPESPTAKVHAGQRGQQTIPLSQALLHDRWGKAWCLGGLGRGHRCRTDIVIVARELPRAEGLGGRSCREVGLCSISPERLGDGRMDRCWCQWYRGKRQKQGEECSKGARHAVGGYRDGDGRQEGTEGGCGSIRAIRQHARWRRRRNT